MTPEGRGDGYEKELPPDNRVRHGGVPRTAPSRALAIAQRAHEREALADRAPEGEGGSAHHRADQLPRADPVAPGRHQRAPAAPGPRAGGTRPEAGRARLDPRPPPGRAG